MNTTFITTLKTLLALGIIYWKITNLFHSSNVHGLLTKHKCLIRLHYLQLWRIMFGHSYMNYEQFRLITWLRYSPWHILQFSKSTKCTYIISKGKGNPRQAEVALGVQGRLRPQILSTFGTTRVVGRRPNAPAACTPGEIPGTHFQRLSRPQGTWFCRKEPRKKSQVTPPGIDPGTVRLVAQRLNHYATPGPLYVQLCVFNFFYVVRLDLTYW
jgi:hypothetical protein